jgi:hypothetical protein
MMPETMSQTAVDKRARKQRKNGGATFRPRKPKKPGKAGNPLTDGAPPRPRCTDVNELPENLQKLIDRMLINGSTFEDTVEAVNQLGQEQISLAAVEIHFRSSPSLQRSRVRSLQTITQNLRSAFTNPDDAQSELAQVIMMTGLMGLRTGSAMGDVQQAVRAKQQHENQQLQQATFRLKTRKSFFDIKMLQVRLRVERKKLELAAHKVGQLKKSVEREGAGSTLTAEMIQRINEVYGIVS